MTLKSLSQNKLIRITILLYAITILSSKNIASSALSNTTHYLKEMLFVMPLILILTILIDVWISKETIIKNMGEGSGLKGTAFSVLLGSLSAGPIYAAFPICKMLLKKGASIANIVVILSAWAVIKVPMLANETKFLGLNFMTIRWVLTVIIIYGMGYIMSLLVKKDDLPNESSRPTKNLTIHQSSCIGCGICAKKFPQHFIMINQKAQLQQSKSTPPDMTRENLCPVHAIQYT